MVRKAMFNIAACLVFVAPNSIAEELISFRGVPLDQPNVINALVEICKENNHNHGNDCDADKAIIRLRKGWRWTFFVNYGGLSGLTLGNFSTGADYSLVEVEIRSSKGEVLALAKLLTDKYGKPKKTTEQVTNGLGTKFDKETFVWTDSQGSRIMIESMYNKIDEGRIVIDSPSSVAAKKTEEKLNLEAAKQRL